MAIFHELRRTFNSLKPTALQWIKESENDERLNGEGGIRTHEGVTPTRFRVVRNQPDSATSPHAIGVFSL